LLLLASSIVYKLPFANTLMYPIVLALVGVAIASARRVWAAKAPTAPFLAGVLAIVGYITLYSRDSRALQIWYAASFAAPLVLIGAPACAALRERPRIAASVAAGVMAAGVFTLSLLPMWPNQKALKDAGDLLAAQPRLTPVGAWNAGTIAYFAGRPVTNLDGLVNDDILPYARGGTLLEYVSERHLAYIVDYAAMFGKELALRGGYADGTLARCSKARGQIDADKPKQLWQGSPLTVYEVDELCLRSRLSSVR
jgi:hypothetical protein